MFAVLVVDCCLHAWGAFVLLLCSNSSTIFFFARLSFKMGLGGDLVLRKKERYTSTVRAQLVAAVLIHPHV